MSKKDKNHFRPKEQAAPIEEPATFEQTSQDAPAQEPTLEAEQTLEQQLGELHQKYQRLAADFQNYQKRSIRQVEQAGQFAQENLAKLLLPVLDNLEHTLEKGADTQDIQALIKGVKIVYDHFMDTLSGAGVKPITIEPGCEFDPNRHEALMQIENTQVPTNHVVQELAKGYTMNDRTLRPAKVSVAKAPTPVAEPESESQEENQENNHQNSQEM